jgi:sec-independent protein translocase protein TatA
MADIGLPELLIVLAIVLLIFGPSKIMGVAAGLGGALRAFRHSMQDTDEVAAAKEQRTENKEPEIGDQEQRSAEERSIRLLDRTSPER